MKSFILTTSYLFLAFLNAYVLPFLNDTVKHSILRNSANDYSIIMAVTIFFFAVFNIVLIGTIQYYKKSK